MGLDGGNVGALLKFYVRGLFKTILNCILAIQKFNKTFIGWIFNNEGKSWDSEPKFVSF